jgi:hypothetical protein
MGTHSVADVDNQNRFVREISRLTASFSEQRKVSTVEIAFFLSVSRDNNFYNPMILLCKSKFFGGFSGLSKSVKRESLVLGTRFQKRRRQIQLEFCSLGECRLLRLFISTHASVALLRSKRCVKTMKFGHRSIYSFAGRLTNLFNIRSYELT